MTIKFEDYITESLRDKISNIPKRTNKSTLTAKKKNVNIKTLDEMPSPLKKNLHMKTMDKIPEPSKKVHNMGGKKLSDIPSRTKTEPIIDDIPKIAPEKENTMDILKRFKDFMKGDKFGNKNTGKYRRKEKDTNRIGKFKQYLK